MCFIVSVVVVVFRFFLFLVSAFKLREMILLNNITWLICVLFSFLFDLLLFKNRFPSLTAHSQQIPKMPQVGTEWPRERIERQSKMMNKWRSKWSITKWNVALVFRTLVFFLIETNDQSYWFDIYCWTQCQLNRLNLYWSVRTKDNSLYLNFEEKTPFSECAITDVRYKKISSLRFIWFFPSRCFKNVNGFSFISINRLNSSWASYCGEYWRKKHYLTNNKEACNWIFCALETTNE